MELFQGRDFRIRRASEEWFEAAFAADDSVRQQFWCVELPQEDAIDYALAMPAEGLAGSDFGLPCTAWHFLTWAMQR